MRRPLAAAAAGLALVAGAGAAACSSSSPPSHPPPSSSQQQKPADTNPPGDIPDTQAFVPWSSPDGAFTVKVPEGWSRSSQGAATVFTDKFNSVRAERVPATTAPTVDSVRMRDIPEIQAGSRHFSLVSVTEVQRKGGKAVLAEYHADSAPDQVTGKSVPLDVQRYVFFSPGKGEAVLTLSGGVGADNVDPWRTVTDSFRWS
ncbi:hypothetical protein J7W19_16005 [Streptomyces mobaraensis NBRC 13819 = DSM 40847]|nr:MULTISPECIES: hypothetical protein [Streptomyces]EMF01789.1 lipoprotein [Streptomyces mobaraensis NBRC 13819 = DSM 40847]QTT74696.1 hypothetical protein J7W19_16005 [Streptomyces mobaraensis NBRC 13819 = DSM 40847]